jgi:hypothetical protein
MFKLSIYIRVVDEIVMNLNHVTKDVRITFYQQYTKITVELVASETVQL